MGQKNGRVRDLQKLVGTATPEQKPAVGKRFNEVRTSVSAALEARTEELKSQAITKSCQTLMSHCLASDLDRSSASDHAGHVSSVS
jgi:phenylalanyl-tRNA synthetase alpha subunit